ncbi:MAG: GAF domain-containing protein [Deltaproteobacteria bacterium]|nr:GAF domain-containing protein [Deltaproteobacteria bacterium]
MNLNIRLKLVAFTVCVVLLVGGSISLYSILQVREQILTTFEDQSQEITAMISRDILNPLYFFDISSLRRQLENIRLNPDFSYTYITDLNGVVLADGTRENSLRDQRLSDPFSKEVMLADHWISRTEEGTLKIGGPVFMADGSRIGYLQAGFALHRIYQIINDTTKTSLYITFICLGIGAILAVLLSASFTQPILSIARASREIGAGKLDTRLPINRGDELGTLAESINQMAVNLKINLERIQALHEINLATTSTLDTQAVLDLLLVRTALLLPYSAATVTLLNRETGELESVAGRNLNGEKWGTSWRKVETGLARAVFENKAPLAVGNIQTDRRTRDRDFFLQHGLVSYLGVPLAVKDDILGVLSFYAKEEHQFSNDEVEFLTTLAGQVAIAVHNSQLYDQTKRQAVELVTANKAKDEFLSVMSHELRTPLNVVMGYVGMINDGLLGDINPDQERALGKVISRSEDLLRMINEILQATSLEARAVKAESREISLGSFLDDLRSNYEIPMDKQLALNWDYPAELPVMRTDSEKLKHILENLINNAVKFTIQGNVTVSARYNPKAKAVEFKVADTGVGIQEEMIPSIFEMFRQGDSSETRPYGGVGIGLYIVKKFTDLLGGKIEAASEPGKGSIFTVTIPC